MDMVHINKLLDDYMKVQDEESELAKKRERAKKRKWEKCDKIVEYMCEGDRRQVKEFVAKIQELYYLVKFDRSLEVPTFTMDLIGVYPEGNV